MLQVKLLQAHEGGGLDDVSGPGVGEHVGKEVNLVKLLSTYHGCFTVVEQKKRNKERKRKKECKNWTGTNL